MIGENSSEPRLLQDGHTVLVATLQLWPVPHRWA